MDQVMTGELIRRLRTDMGLTQKQLAEKLHVSDKAVSKWETGGGCPDVLLLPVLAEVFGVDMQALLSGSIDKNEKEKGNMKKLRFYVCESCANIITSSSDAQVSCCGKKLAVLDIKKADDNEKLSVKDTGGELYVSSDHEMTKEHHISFVAYQSDNCIQMFKQYPEWNISINMPLYRYGRLVWYCNKCGLLYQEL